MIRRINSLLFYALFILFASCKSSLIRETTYATDRIVGYQQYSELTGQGGVYISYPSHYSGNYKDSYYTRNHFTSNPQSNAIKYLEDKIKKYPEEKKYREALDDYEKKLYSEYRKRVEDRMVFLRDFYSDLYRLSNNEFSKKYKKHCDKKLLTAMNESNIQGEKFDGNHWFVFTDLQLHRSNDFKFQYMDFDPKKIGNSFISMKLYRDSVKQKVPNHRFYDQEDKWYKVSMGENYTLVKVEGEKNSIKIKELINTSIPFVHYTKPSHYEEGTIYTKDGKVLFTDNDLTFF